jgi:hypothetical protein
VFSLEESDQPRPPGVHRRSRLPIGHGISCQIRSAAGDALVFRAAGTASPGTLTLRGANGRSCAVSQALRGQARRECGAEAK